MSKPTNVSELESKNDSENLNPFGLCKGYYKNIQNSIPEVAFIVLLTYFNEPFRKTLKSF